MNARVEPGQWEISFIENMSAANRGIKAGFYVSRSLPGSKAPNAREWIQRGPAPRRFVSLEDAQVAILKEGRK